MLVKPRKKTSLSAVLSEKRARTMLARLGKLFPPEHAFLRFSTPMQLLVAVILSAQCTDKKVNEVTEPLFRTHKTAADFARISQKDLEHAIHATGFFRQKARHIRETARAISTTHNGTVPETLAELVRLPGVGRKTANVVLQVGSGKREGIPVDTHVGRIARRWKLTDAHNPDSVERTLMQTFPKKDWTRAPYLMIMLGRAYCTSQKPKCAECPLKAMCPSSTQKN